jgi:hypothetical protein
MCNHEEWETFRRRFAERIGEGQVREFVADAAARIEAFAEDLKGRACAPEDADSQRLYFDQVELMIQLGLMPGPAAATA